MKTLLTLFLALFASAAMAAQPAYQRNFATTNGPITIAFDDAGAHRIWGWDDTDNQAKGFIIGGGLSYDPATDTLTASGSGNTFNVNQFSVVASDVALINGVLLTNPIVRSNILAVSGPGTNVIRSGSAVLLQAYGEAGTTNEVIMADNNTPALVVAKTRGFRGAGPGITRVNGGPAIHVSSVQQGNNTMGFGMGVATATTGGTNLILSSEGDGPVYNALAASSGVNIIQNNGLYSLEASGAGSTNSMASSGGLGFANAVSGGYNIATRKVLFQGYADGGTNNAGETFGQGFTLLGYAASLGLNVGGGTGSRLFGFASLGGINRVTGDGAFLFGMAQNSNSVTATGSPSWIFSHANTNFGSSAVTAANTYFFGSGNTNSTAHSFQVSFGSTNEFRVTKDGVGIGTGAVAAGDVLRVVGATTFNGSKTNLDLTASALMATDANKREASLLIGSGLSSDGTTLTATAVGISGGLHNLVTNNAINLSNIVDISTATNQPAWYKTISIPAYSFTPATNTPEAVTWGDINTTNKFLLSSYAFDDTAREGIWNAFAMPDDWDKGAVKFKFTWGSSTATSGSVAWYVALASQTNELGVAIGVTNSPHGSVSNLVTTAATAAVTPSATLLSSDVIKLYVYRDTSIASDMTGDAKLVNVDMQYRLSTTPQASW